MNHAIKLEAGRTRLGIIDSSISYGRADFRWGHVTSPYTGTPREGQLAT